MGLVERGYVGQVLQVRPVLAAMEDRGLPVDDAARVALGGEFEIAQAEVGAELTRLAPGECSRVHPKGGYKGVPPAVKGWQDGSRPGNTNVFGNLVEWDDGERYRYETREFKVPDDNLQMILTSRWCRVYDFNPNSSQQLLAYMDAKGHKRPKSRKNEDAEGNAKDTTEKKELVRLAARHGDPFYLKVIEFRELSKARGTYVDGFKPGADGCVHTTFTFDTGTGQLSSRNPNVQNFPKHGRLAKSLRKMIAAPDGHVLVELDYRAFHVLTTGFEAESANWMRLARLDMHSFVAGCFLRLWGAEVLREADGALLERFAWLKGDSERKRIRDKQAKPSILGIGFGMGYRRLYFENMESFAGEREAKGFHDLLRALFPEVFAWQKRIQRKAHEDCILRSRFGHARRFYEVFRWDAKKGDWAPGDQAEEAVAFLPANHAHGHLRAVMKDLAAAAGMDEKYGMCDQIHDALIFCPRAEDSERCVADVARVMMAPSRILIHPTLAPGGLSCEVEASWGPNWRDMTAVAIPTEVTHA